MNMSNVSRGIVIEHVRSLPTSAGAEETRSTPNKDAVSTRRDFIPRVPTGSRAFRHLAAIATKEFADQCGSGWVLVCMLVWIGAVGLTSLFGLIQIGQIGLQGFERTVVSLLSLVQFLVPLLGLLLGHELLVGEAENRTSRLILAAGVDRKYLLLGKFIGGCLTLSVPLVLGFGFAGLAIALSSGVEHLAPFLKLAFSGLVLGVLFVALGIALSAFSRTRVQALVLALLAWGLAVFVFDLAALGVFVSAKATAASHEIEVVCDATHVNAAADLHAGYDSVSDAPAAPRPTKRAASLGWLAVNPVDVFRAINLPAQYGIRVSSMNIGLSISGWLALTLGAASWKFRRADL